MPDFDQAQWDAYCDAGGDNDHSAVAAETAHFANEAAAAEVIRRLKEAEAAAMARAKQVLG